jgi:hypothetical protein
MLGDNLCRYISQTTKRGLKMKSNAQLLQDALDLLGPNGENWTRGVYARNAQQQEVSFESQDACRFCAQGAIRTSFFRTKDVINAGRRWDLTDLLDNAARKIDNRYAATAVAFNDRTGQTFDNIKLLFQTAISLAQEQEHGT